MSPSSFRVPARRQGGYTLLAVTLVLIALALVMAAGLALSMSERKGGFQAQADTAAQAAAEAGLERTVAYLAGVVELDGDYDRALDPGLDTTCAAGATLVLGGTRTDDHLPTFAGTVVTVGPVARAWKQVAFGGGAYLVRLEDNQDDLGPDALYPFTTGNHGCVEGSALGAARQNPLRDRDRTVVATVIGIYPGTDFARARARHTLRVEVSPNRAAGLIAGGDIDFGGTSQICGAYGDVQSTGDVNAGCLCGAGCVGGPVGNRCSSAPGGGTNCEAQSSGGTCSAGAGGGTSTCVANASVPPPPPVQVWSAVNAPPASLGPNYIPFWFLLWNDALAPARAEVYAWNYGGAGCQDPRAVGRICRPNETVGPCVGLSSCWALVRFGAAGNEAIVNMADNAGFTTVSLPAPGAGYDVWKAQAVASHANGAGCEGSDPGPYPGAAIEPWLAPDALREVKFELLAAAPNLLPRGVWFVEGDLEVSVDTPDCTLLPAGWSASLLVTGDALTQGNMLALRPAHPKGYALMVGRDLTVKTGNTGLSTCGLSAAVLVHEQFRMGANAHLEAQLVVENKSGCSDTLPTGGAGPVDFQGNASVFVIAPPPYSAGRPAGPHLRGESTH